MAAISTHVLDTSIGRPAAGIPVHLESQRAMGWAAVSHGTTDDDGRVRALGDVPAGTYRIRFEVAAYFGGRGAASFFPHVEIAFIVADAPHYHVPLLISPFGYSTYRGS
jgi:5-hydroxyisourate hydrolase